MAVVNTEILAELKTALAAGLIALTLASAIPACAEGLQFINEKSAQKAGRLVLCSDWPEFSASRFQDFLSQTDLADSGLEIVSGPSGPSDKGPFSVLLITTTGAPSDNVLRCAADSLNAPDDPVWEKMKASIAGFGENPYRTWVQLPPGMTWGPVREQRSYFQVADQWLVILNQSAFAPGQRTNAAMVGVLDLDASVCKANGFCF